MPCKSDEKQAPAIWQTPVNRNLLTLGELGSATGSLQTVLLALLHTRIAGQETGLLQNGAVILAGQQQSAGHTVTQSAGR